MAHNLTFCSRFRDVRIRSEEDYPLYLGQYLSTVPPPKEEMATMFKTRHTKSEVWRYFEYVSVDSAKCNECGKFYSRKGRTTTSLKNHLKSAHLEHYLEFITADKVRLDKKTILKPQEKSAFTILDTQQPQTCKKHIASPADQQICGLSSGGRKATEVYEMKAQTTTTIDDDFYRDPISITMSPNRDIKPEILNEYEETQLSSNHSICMEHTSDINTVGDSVKQVEVDEKVTTEDSSNSPLATRTHRQEYSNWEEDMRRKKLRLELEYLELTNYKIKLELYEMEQKLKLNPSKFTAGIRCQQLPN